MAQKSFIDILYDASQALNEVQKNADKMKTTSGLPNSKERRLSCGSSFKMTDEDRNAFEITYDENGVSFDTNWRFKIKSRNELDTLIMHLLSIRESMD